MKSIYQKLQVFLQIPKYPATISPPATQCEFKTKRNETKQLNQIKLRIINAKTDICENYSLGSSVLTIFLISHVS